MVAFIRPAPPPALCQPREPELTCTGVASPPGRRRGPGLGTETQVRQRVRCLPTPHPWAPGHFFLKETGDWEGPRWP